MAIYLGLGSNLGDRRANLRRALELLERESVTIQRVSPIVESPALLPEGAPPEWNMPFLNLAVECRTAASPHELVATIKDVERTLGRAGTERWSPRPADIDILLWNQEVIADARLVIPHRDLTQRAFVLSPMIALEPRLTVPGHGEKTLLEHSIELGQQIPLWMGIVNVTPDSFSDGGRYVEWPAIEAHVEAMLAAGAQMIDIGSQSTRPGAVPISADEEWQRLEPALTALVARYRSQPLRPLVSVDTFYPSVAERALARGADMINDVTGLGDPAMIELARASGKDWIAMHSLGIPADRERTLPRDSDPVAIVKDWLRRRLETWSAAGLDLNRIVFDCGIGFGKDPLQSSKLLRAAGEFRAFGLRALVGHSRKSFLRNVTRGYEEERDLATIGASLHLCQQGVDILRVHDVPGHAAAYRGWSHLRG
jgi:2-amino-4-hydroxy-6-hydroxymethyldihydropteridine diphosphokinase / dihydropteroate synthase